MAEVKYDRDAHLMYYAMRDYDWILTCQSSTANKQKVGKISSVSVAPVRIE